MANKTNNADGYTSTIKESYKPLSGKEKVRYKDLTASRKLDELVTESESMRIDFANYILLGVHNPSADNPDYNVVILVDKNGESFYTSSDTFYRALTDIIESMDGETEEWGIEVVKRPSSNYKGKFFITCTVY